MFITSNTAIFAPAVLGLLIFPPAATPQQQRSTQPTYTVTVVERSTPAVNYHHRGGATKIDFEGTPLLPRSSGEAKVESKKGYIEIEVEFDELQPATKFGPEYLTYVLWAITPEGRATNLGEVLVDGNRGKLNVTTELQSFGMILTAEPYFAVTQPGNVVVMENAIRSDTAGRVDVLDARYELLERGHYVYEQDRAGIQRMVISEDVPLELYEARNALQIARWAGAEKYASETFEKAAHLLTQAEDHQARKAGRRPVIMSAREAVQTAEDARLIAVKNRQAERVARTEREAAAARTEAGIAARQKAEAEQARRQAEEDARRAAEDRRRAEEARAAALEQRQAAQGEAERARQFAREADAARIDAERRQQQLRAELLSQLNAVLETRETARGLIVNVSDVLFDVDKATLKPGAREKLAKVSGILVSHPGLTLEVEGHTDSTGAGDYNQSLSEKRAAAVREYLVSQGVSSETVSARGFGESQPVASNDSAAGRQQNRRVEIVVSGDLIAPHLESQRPR